MKTAFHFLSAAFRLLVLKPFDFLLFGGAGVLTIPRAEWQKMIQNDVHSSGPCKAQIRVDDWVEESAPFPKLVTTNLPTVYDGPQGDSFFMDIEK